MNQIATALSGPRDDRGCTLNQIATASVHGTGPRDDDKDVAIVPPPPRGLNQRFLDSNSAQQAKELLENVVAILSAICKKKEKALGLENPDSRPWRERRDHGEV